MFGCKIYILNTKDQLGNFLAKVNDGILVEYSKSSKAYRICNKRTHFVEKSLNIIFEENLSSNSAKMTDEEILFELTKLTIEEGIARGRAKQGSENEKVGIEG